MIDAHSFKAVLAVLIVYLGITTAFLVSLLYFQKRQLPYFRGSGVFFLISGSLGFLLPVMIELGVMPHMPVTIFLFIGTLAPVATLGITAIFRLEKVGIQRVFGAILGILAVYLALGNPFQNHESWSFWYLVALIMPLSYGVVDCYVERCWPKDMGLLHIAAGDAATALCICIVLGLLLGVTPDNVITTVHKSPWLLIGLSVSALCASLMFFFTVRHAGAVFTSFATFASLLLGLLADSLFFNAILSDSIVVAFLLFIFSLLLLNLHQHKP